MLEESEDIFSECGRFGVASAGWSAEKGDEEETDIGPSVRTSQGLRCCAVDESKSIAKIDRQCRPKHSNTSR